LAIIAKRRTEEAMTTRADMSAVDEAIVALAKAQMRASLASLTLTALASGDVVVSIVRKAGHGDTPYAHVQKLTRRLKHLEKAR
jgi:hypothetical protein